MCGGMRYIVVASASHMAGCSPRTWRLAASVVGAGIASGADSDVAVSTDE